MCEQRFIRLFPLTRLELKPQKLLVWIEMVVREEPPASEVEKTTDVLMSITQSAITLFAGLASILAAILASVWGVSEFSWLPVEVWIAPVVLWMVALVVFIIQIFGRWKSRFIHDRFYEYLRGGPDT